MSNEPPGHTRSDDREHSNEAATQLHRDAQTYGFDVLGITDVTAIAGAGDYLAHFLSLGRHGEMTWMADTASRRSSPQKLWPECRSAILLGMSYAPGHDPLDRVSETHRGVIACYAKGRDYHQLIKGRLKQIAGRFAARTGGDVKVFVDTAPLMEKPLATAAGLGWQGKHTNLVSRQAGSWLLLGCILTTAQLNPSQPHRDRCGSCRKCLQICPTNAFPAPYQLDARRCIAYLTIEYAGHIPSEFRRPIGNRVFGCDDCLAVCPWNKFAVTARETQMHARRETDDPGLAELADMDDAAFRKRFAGTAIRRTGRDRFMRNVLIAIGNSGDCSLATHVRSHLNDRSALVRAMAVWALVHLIEPEELKTLADYHINKETDTTVRDEWTAAFPDKKAPL
ncbi:MAG: tRNA epoxyqueuosine(34) reductase QueG [Pseudomonadota bacterium]